MKRITVLAAALFFICGMVSVGEANDISGRLGVDGSFGAAIPVGPEYVGDADNEGYTAGVGLRYGITKRWSVAAAGDDVRVNDGVQLQPITLSLAYMFMPQHRLTPIASIGAGVAALGDNYDFNIPAAKAGLGLEYFVTKNWTLSALAQYHLVHGKGTTAFDEDVQALTGNLMLTWFLGANDKSAAEKAVAEEAAPAAAKAQEEAKQTAAAVQPPPPAETAAVAAAAAAPVVPAAIAPAPEIARDTKTMQLNVLFDSQKTVLKDEYIPEVNRLSDFLTKYPETAVVIEGHTDSTGTEENNKKLSQARADSIRSYLMEKKGISGDRVKAVGYGSSKPVADNTTEEGRAKNRRVMVEFSSAN